jgi:hypothetical protein
MKKEHRVGVAIAGFAVLAIIGLATGGGKATPTGNTSPIASSSALASAVASATVAATSTTPAPAAATKVKAKPRRTAAPAAPAPTKTKAVVPPPPPTTAPAAVPSTPSGCYPLTNSGKCYEPGEYCRNSDHGASGVAGDGERIVCEDNDGWRWEPV